MELDLPLYALQRSAPGWWLLRAPSDDPFLPAVCLVAAINEGYAGGTERRSSNVRPFDPDKTLTRGEISNIDLRADLLELARLLDHLSPPDYRNPELYFEQRSAIVHELKRLARSARHVHG